MNELMCDLWEGAIEEENQPISLRQNNLMDWFVHLVTLKLLRVLLPHTKHEPVVSQAILLSHLARHRRNTPVSVRAQVAFSKKLIERANLTCCAKFLIQKHWWRNKGLSVWNIVSR